MQYEAGFIYAIQMGNFPIYKIGKTKNLPQRLSDIGIQLPFPYRIVFAHRVPSVSDFERKIHKVLAVHRMNGEWFKLSQGHLDRTRYYLLSVQSATWADAITNVLEDGKIDPLSRSRLKLLLSRLKERMTRQSVLANTYCDGDHCMGVLH